MQDSTGDRPMLEKSTEKDDLDEGPSSDLPIAVDALGKPDVGEVDAAYCFVELQQLRKDIDLMIQLRINSLFGPDAAIVEIDGELAELDQKSQRTVSKRRWAETGCPAVSEGTREAQPPSKQVTAHFSSEDTSPNKLGMSERGSSVQPSMMSYHPQVSMMHTYSDEERMLKEAAAKRDEAIIESERQAALLHRASQEALQSVHSFTKKIVEHSRFEFFFGSLVFLSSLITGLDVELANDDPRRDALQVVTDLLSLAFVLELVLRLFAKGLSFFRCGPDVAWNYLDFIFVMLSALQYSMKWASDGSMQTKSGEAGLMVIRLSRFVRFMKVIRVIRVMRFFRALRILVYSICGTLKSLVWAMMLLVLIIYLFAIVFTQAIREHVDVNDPAEPSDTLLLEYFGTIPRSVLTLYKCITSGMNWEIAANMLEEVHPVYTAVLLVYVTFGILAVLNVITGFFCNSAIENAESDDEELIQTQLKSTGEWRLKFEEIFKQIDEYHSGKITLKQFETYCDNDRVQGYFEALGIDARDAWRIFKILDMDESGTIEVSEFVDGCLQMRGSARRIDVGEVLVRNRWIMNQMVSLLDLVKNSMQQVQAAQGERRFEFAGRRLKAFRSREFHLHAPGGVLSI